MIHYLKGGVMEELDDKKDPFLEMRAEAESSLSTFNELKRRFQELAGRPLSLEVAWDEESCRDAFYLLAGFRYRFSSDDPSLTEEMSQLKYWFFLWPAGIYVAEMALNRLLVRGVALKKAVAEKDGQELALFKDQEEKAASLREEIKASGDIQEAGRLVTDYYLLVPHVAADDALAVLGAFAKHRAVLIQQDLGRGL